MNIVIVFCGLFWVGASHAGFSDVALNKMTYQDAKEYCSTNFKSLPTVRDFAEWSIANGAVGILDQKIIDSGNIPDGYYLVASVYDNGSTDSFYFSHQGFRKPKQSIPDDSYWTLSTMPQNHEYAHVFYTAFGGGGGKPEEHKKSFKNAVICLE